MSEKEKVVIDATFLLLYLTLSLLLNLVIVLYHQGKGLVKLNGSPIEHVKPEELRLKVKNDDNYSNTKL